MRGIKLFQALPKVVGLEEEEPSFETEPVGETYYNSEASVEAGY